MNYSLTNEPGAKLTKRGDNHTSASQGSGKGENAKLSNGQPAWAKGLQSLYNQVVEESLPPDLAALLDKLDKA